MNQQTLYRDIALRTDGDIYIGVVGPVRTGKSTFIKRFMELLVLPNIEGEHRRERMIDELPLSGAGRTIMTAQPHFVPDKAIDLSFDDSASFRVRLVDCAGYLIPGALGTQEGEAARMVRTPWFSSDIPFEEAAEIGTRKVITDHSTMGIVVTTDGSITDLPRSSYIEAEERVVGELKALGKPFAIALNCAEPASTQAAQLRTSLAEKYDIPVVALNAQEMTADDLTGLLSEVLYEFPVSEIWCDMPGWITTLPNDHYLKQSIIQSLKTAGDSINRIRDYTAVEEAFQASELAGVRSAGDISLNEGTVAYQLDLDDGLFYRVLSEECGEEICGDEHLFAMMSDLVKARSEYARVAEALDSVRKTGYGMVAPEQSELSLMKPELVKQGNRFGVKLRATAPSLHLIRVDIQTEVSPIVGTEKQSEELIGNMLSDFETDPDKLWDTNMFGKSLNDMVREGLSTKLMRMPDDTRMKMQEALQKIINEGNGGMICILL